MKEHPDIQNRFLWQVLMANATWNIGFIFVNKYQLTIQRKKKSITTIFSKIYRWIQTVNKSDTGLKIFQESIFPTYGFPTKTEMEITIKQFDYRARQEIQFLEETFCLLANEERISSSTLFPGRTGIKIFKDKARKFTNPDRVSILRKWLVDHFMSMYISFDKLLSDLLEETYQQTEGKTNTNY